MKRIATLICAVLVLLSSLALFACSSQTEAEGNGDDKKYFKVTFNSDGGSYVDEKNVGKGKTIPRPISPTKEGYIFSGWYEINEDGTVSGIPWNFELNTVSHDTALKAKWTLPDKVFVFASNGDDKTATITGVRDGIGGLIMELTLPEAIGGYNVTAIGNNAFEKLSSEDFTSITVPKNITIIGDEAFYGSKDIKIVVEGQLTSIGVRAFYDCNGLLSVNFGEGLERVTSEAFCGCSSLAAVSIPKSVKVIEENAFDSCTALRSVTLYTDMEAVENMAFDEATALKTLYFYGEETDIDNFLENKVEFGNDTFLDAKVLVFSETEPEKETAYGGYWYLDKNGKIKLWS